MGVSVGMSVEDEVVAVGQPGKGSCVRGTGQVKGMVGFERKTEKNKDTKKVKERKKEVLQNNTPDLYMGDQ